GRRSAHTFDELSRASNRFANALAALGVERGDRVAGYLPRVPEVLVAMVGAWKVGAIHVPIFAGFGPDAIAYRMEHSAAKVLCTHGEYGARVPPVLPGGARVVTVTDGADLIGGDLSFHAALAAQPDRFRAARVRRDEPAVLLYTSGSTGPPKG